MNNCLFPGSCTESNTDVNFFLKPINYPERYSLGALFLGTALGVFKKFVIIVVGSGVSAENKKTKEGNTTKLHRTVAVEISSRDQLLSLTSQYCLELKLGLLRLEEGNICYYLYD